MSHISRLILLSFVVCWMSACHETHFNPNVSLSADSFSDLEVAGYRMDKERIYARMARIARSDHDTLSSDYFVRSYYKEDGPLLWVTRGGVNPGADSLLKYLKRVGDMGFSSSCFFVREIEADLGRMRDLDFSDSVDINDVVARLDYHLTKAYLRYLGGQSHGFVNPRRLLNRLVPEQGDSTGKLFRHVFDVEMTANSREGYTRMLGLIAKDSVGTALRQAEPHSALYDTLKAMLPKTYGAERERVLVNMERCRWRTRMRPEDFQRRVEVNIPSYTLIAYGGDSILKMRVVCGSRKTPTPMLSSYITRMELNPKWIVPYSIVKNEIARHAGDSGYFARNNYHIVEKGTGRRMAVGQVSYGMFRSGNYRVIQEGGDGNSLGRIIFRFDNNFSVYLHDTPSKSTFQRTDRSVSHGCVRVERPYDLASFLLGGEEETLKKVAYSMTFTSQKSPEDEPVDRKMIIHSAKVTPSVPVFLTYYTLCLMPDGKLLRHPDVYGYDEAIADRLRDLCQAGKEKATQ